MKNRKKGSDLKALFYWCSAEATPDAMALWRTLAILVLGG
jgi:hypothetical protein